MTIAASLFAIALYQQGTTTPAPVQGGLVVEGRPVELVLPAPTGNPDNGVLTWKGLGYLGGAAAKLADRYTTGIDWSNIQKPTPYNADAVAWRMRVVLFTSVQTTKKGRYGYESSIRYSFDDSQLEEIKQSLVRLVAWVAFYTNGQVRLMPEVTVERGIVPGASTSAEFAREYFSPRINGGGYEAEDKVFRGPYQSGLYVVPGPSAGEAFAATLVHGTPVMGIAGRSSLGAYTPGALDPSLRNAWKVEVRAHLIDQGFAPLTSDNKPAAPGAWAQAADMAPVTTEALLDRLKNKKSLPLGLDVPSDSLYRAVQSSYTEVSIADDPDRGNILHYVEKGSDRNGGYLLPVRADGKPVADLSKTPTFSFWLKSKNSDPIGVTLIGPEKKEVRVSLGRSDVAGICSSPEPVVPFVGDGTWQQVSIDAKALAEAAGFHEVESIAIEPTPGAILNGRIGIGDIAVDFSDFRFTSDPAQALLPDPKPDATSAIAEDRALFAAQATESSPALIGLLLDSSPLVRLNAAERYETLKDNNAQPNLIKCLSDLNEWIGSTALRALMNQGGEIALVAVRRSTKVGATPLVRATAGELLGATKDPTYLNDISALLVDRNWQNRLASIRALSQLPGREAAIVRTAFLDQTEPEIKLAAIDSVDPADEYQERKLLWSAVNEPSDLVRANSDIKLIQSPNETIRSEGYKGVRDDSRTTRMLLLGYMALHPNEAHRNALRLAVTDRSPEVREAALLAFAALENAVQLDEIANVQEDPDPRVQLALQVLAKKKGLILSPATRQLMAHSPVENVRNGVADLPK